MNRKSILRSITVILILSFIMTAASSCSIFKSREERIEEGNEKYQKIVDEKASKYGIDPDGVIVEEGGEYFKVPMEPVTSVEEMDDLIVNFRKWLRFAYNEFGSRYDVGFYDSEHSEVLYCGFSNQDFGYPSEYYWSDRNVLYPYILRVHSYVNGNKDDKVTSEEFFEFTGIDEEIEQELWDWFHETFYSRPSFTPDKNDHDITFIPGENIEHLEKFVIGDEDCEIDPGTYLIDVPDRYGLIHITDEDGNDKCRLYCNYRDGRTDGMYEYSALPAEVELEEGDIIYITNCVATFDEI